jgi:hypothetical protein
MTETDTNRYKITCGVCSSDTWFNNDEEIPMFQQCWRCSEIINGDL